MTFVSSPRVLIQSQCSTVFLDPRQTLKLQNKRPLFGVELGTPRPAQILCFISAIHIGRLLHSTKIQ
jgi:hypothetical protein